MKRLRQLLWVAGVISLLVIVGQTAISQPTGSDSKAVLGQWSSFANMPFEKINHAAVSYNGKIYVFGGTSGTSNSNETFVYDVAADKWTQAANLPDPKNFAVAEEVKGKIYIMGGYSSIAPFSLSPSIAVYDPVANSFSFQNDMPMPVAGAASFTLNDKIYVIGGVNSGWTPNSTLDLVQVYDPSIDSWSNATSIPFQARNIAAAAVGSTVVIAGGYGPNSPLSKDYVYRGEISGSTITWTQVANYPEGGIHRVLGGASPDKMFFTGGQTATQVPAGTYVFNLDNNSWEAQQDKPSAVHSAGKLVFASGMLYALGGQMRSGQSAVTEAILTEAKPVLKVDTKEVTSTLQIGKTKRYTVQVSNPGAGTLTWNAEIEPSGTTWATLNSSSGSIPTDQMTGISMTLSTVGLPVGDYTATLKITSNDPDPTRGTASVPINLHVQTDPPYTGKGILVEEFTGTWCPYCPRGVDSLHSILQRYPNGEVVIASYHYGDVMTPPELDGRGFNFLHAQFFPGALIDRTKFPAEQDTLVGTDVWGRYVESTLATEQKPVDIYFSDKKYNPVTRQTILKINVQFLQAVQPPVRLNVLQLETGQNYLQENAYGPSIYPYYHEHVVKWILPDIYGESISDNSTVASGTLFTKEYAFASRDSVADNCELIAFVHKGTNAGTGTVLHAVTEGFMDNITIMTDVDKPVVIPVEYHLGQNFPNPFNPSTSITYSVPKSGFVTLRVFNTLGENVATLINSNQDAGTYTVQWNAERMSSGVYHYTLEAGTARLTRKMTLMK